MKSSVIKGKLNIIVAIVFLVILLAICYVGIFAFAALFLIENEINEDQSKDKTEYDTTVTAVITENRLIGTSRGKGVKARPVNSYRPVYRYEYKGKTYTVFGDAASSKPHYNVGDEVVVSISSEDPEKMLDPDFNPQTEYKDFRKDVFRLKIYPAIFAIVAFIITALIVVILVRGNSRKE